MGSLALASVAAGAADDGEGAVREALSKVIPGAEPDTVRPAQLPGFYEVAFGSELYYVSQDARYLISGDVIDLKQKANLSEQRRGALRLDALAALGEEKMIVYPAKGETKHVVNVFTDIDCGYCRKLHSGMDKMNELGIEVRYLAYPRAGIGSGSYDKAVSVWCADDPKEAMNVAKAGKEPPQAECENPVAEEFKLGQAVGVSGTPALVLEDGTLVPGYVPPERLRAMLDSRGG